MQNQQVILLSGPFLRVVPECDPRAPVRDGSGPHPRPRRVHLLGTPISDILFRRDEIQPTVTLKPARGVELPMLKLQVFQFKYFTYFGTN